ncbi:MAG: inositol monophosphatase family protein [Patescibacteria group bacterium]|nr:inositol monophosphatase family protein [Patescibacteria group bacterium]
MTDVNYGRINPHAIGFIMKEMVRRAIEAIRAERFAFEVHAKEGNNGEMDDIFTSADRAAQEIYVRMIREAFPGYGIVAEEDHLRVEADPSIGMFFTVDPLDGTKAFKRRQSHGIGTMIALVRGTDVIAAYVGDVMTREIYGFRPESDKVHRISEYGFGETLAVDERAPLQDQCVLMRERPESHSKLIGRMVAPRDSKGLFRGVEIATGSIGVSTARLWKGEVGAVLLKPQFETPWDCAPIYGICERMGFEMYVPNLEGNHWARCDMQIFDNTRPCNSEQLIIHSSRFPELMNWLRENIH